MQVLTTSKRLSCSLTWDSARVNWAQDSDMFLQTYIHHVSSDRNAAWFCNCAEFNFKISFTFWVCNSGLRAFKRAGVSQVFAMISVKPLCLQWQEPLIINVASPLHNFSEQRISLPLARAQERENKDKEGVYCQGYLNKWLKGVEDAWQCGKVTTLYGQEWHWHLQNKKRRDSQAP